MNFLILFRILSLISPLSCAVSSCPKQGNYGYKCTSYDYCNTTAGLVCGNGLCGGECPVGWRTYDQTTCYLHVSNALSQESATEACHKLNAQLITVNTAEKLALMRQISENNGDNTLWTGAYLDHQLTYTWPDGTKLAIGTSQWSSGQPSNQRTQFCVRLSWSDGNFRFADTYCSNTYDYVCERRTEKCVNSICNCNHNEYYSVELNKCVLAKTYNQNCTSSNECNAVNGLTCSSGVCKCGDNSVWISADSSCRVCPNGWTKLLDSCYFYHNTASDHDAAESNCNSQEANLVTFETKEEMIAVRNYYLERHRVNFTAWTSATHDGGSNYEWPNGATIPSASNLWCSNKGSQNGVALGSANTCLVTRDPSQSNLPSICEYTEYRANYVDYD